MKMICPYCGEIIEESQPFCNYCGDPIPADMKPELIARASAKLQAQRAEDETRRRAEEARRAEERRRTEEARRAEERRRQEEQRAREAKLAEEQRREEEQKAQEARRAEEQRLAEARKIQEARIADEARRREAEQKAAEAARAAAAQRNNQPFPGYGQGPGTAGKSFGTSGQSSGMAGQSSGLVGQSFGTPGQNSGITGQNYGPGTYRGNAGNAGTGMYGGRVAQGGTGSSTAGGGRTAKKKHPIVLISFVLLFLVAVSVITNAVKNKKATAPASAYDSGSSGYAGTGNTEAPASQQSFGTGTVIDDSETYAEPENDNAFLSVGDHFYFGRYEQDTQNSEVEPIEWIVIDRPTENTVKAISRFCIEAGQYHDYNGPVTWWNSYIRSFLNEYFYYDAFTEDEQGLIINSVNVNEDNPIYGTDGGNDSNDRVFVLSASEAYSYFPTDAGRRGTWTPYTAGKGIFIHDSKRTSPWVLRTPGDSESTVMYVATNGELHNDANVTDTDFGIRPVIQLNISTGLAVDLIEKKVTYKDPNDAFYGDFVQMGSYEQDGNGENGLEPVEWIVLAKTDQYALMITRYVLDCFPYNNDLTDTTWETSSIREWLNSEFLYNTFSDEEIGRIWSVNLPHEDNPYSGTSGGNDTTDAVFLLTLSEADNYFISEVDRSVEATNYAKQKGIFTADSNGLATWFTRTPGTDPQKVTYVYSWGEINYDQEGYAVNEEYKGIRPCILVKVGQ